MVGENRLIVLIGAVAAVFAGITALQRTPLEALPDLSDVQVIVQAEFNEQAPRIVEDQVTYPIAARCSRFPGPDGCAGIHSSACPSSTSSSKTAPILYWARSRVLEYLNGIRASSPPASRRPWDRTRPDWVGSSSTRWRTRRAS
jgi:Cu(I)/Ag(I) efflux system membrane protein CusA/SilA